MPIYLMDKAYRVGAAAGVSANLVVVQGSVAGECTVPGGANAGAILGVTMHSQSQQGRSVAVRKAGIAECVASTAITAGSPVNIAGASGRVKPVSETAGTKINCLGFAETGCAGDGDIVEVFLSIHERIS
jgi:hypothetical protein